MLTYVSESSMKCIIAKFIVHNQVKFRVTISQIVVQTNLRVVKIGHFANLL